MAVSLDREEAKRVTKLCCDLTSFLRAFENPSLASSVFVCAYCTRRYSKYYLLGQTFDASHLNLVRHQLTKLDRNVVFKIAFHLGAALDRLKSSRRKGVGRLIKLANKWLYGDSKSIFDELGDDEDAVWQSAIADWLQTLELVEFRNSLLRKHFSDKAYSFRRIHNVGRLIDPQQEKDPLFNYGAICEELVFGLRNILHICWLDGSRGQYRWALCLWCSEEASDAMTSIGPQLEHQIRMAWESKSSTLNAHEMLSTKRLHDEMENAIREMIVGLAGTNTLEAEQKKRDLLRLGEAFKRCHNSVLLREVLSKFEQQRQTWIAENMSFNHLIRQLEGNAQ